MKFQKHLEEEYLMRWQKYEIFKNPSQREITALSKQWAGKLRFLVDEKDKKTWYLFASNFLHQWALEHMADEDVVEDSTFRSGEIYVYPDKVIVYLFHGTYKLVGRNSIFTSTDYNPDDYKWILNKLKFFNVSQLEIK